MDELLLIVLISWKNVPEIVTSLQAISLDDFLMKPAFKSIKMFP